MSKKVGKPLEGSKAKVNAGIALEPNLIELIDKFRGKISRSKYVEKIIKVHFLIDN